ncbi:MAG: alanine racemase [Pseudomonadota bacterium]
MLTGRLTIDLGAIAADWRALDALTPPGCETAAVVKADAYGCGIAQVSRRLHEAGCRTFFVATPGEGAALRSALGAAPEIHILAGYSAAEEPVFRTQDLRPILNAPGQVSDWLAGPAGSAILQLDTGMNRLGMEPSELAALGPLPPQITHLMSHLACADTPEHPQNAAQLSAFQKMTEGRHTGLTLAATAGILLGPDYHFDMTRPGIGLYGGWPFDAGRHAVTVEVPILQIRDIAAGESVGYAAHYIATRDSRIATLAAGYADGLIRQMGNSGTAMGVIHNRPVPFAGRVSMDLVTLDVTDVPEARPGDMVELIGPNQSIDALAEMTGTIGHEILTSLGARYDRIYL